MKGDVHSVKRLQKVSAMDSEKMGLPTTGIYQNVIKRPKLLKAIVMGLVVFVVVAATTLVAVSISGKMTKDTYQEAWETVQDLEGRYMEERINKSKDMTEIDVPNTVQVIYDYKNNIVVFRYTHSETRIRSPCYVREIDSEYDPKQLEYDIQSEITNIEYIQWQKPNEFSSTTRKWKFTEREVPSYMTSSSRVQDMCSGTQIYWMEVTADTHIEKRQITGTSRELILIISITIFGNPCNIFVYLETISGIPVGISFSQPECTLMTTTTSSMLTSTLSSLTTSSASITSSSTTSTSMTVTSLTTASDPTTSTSLMTTSTPTASTTTDTTASVTSTASITPTPTPTSSVEMTSTSTAQNSTPTTSTPFTTTMTPSTATSTATTTISPTTSTPTATSTEPPC